MQILTADLSWVLAPPARGALSTVGARRHHPDLVPRDRPIRADENFRLDLPLAAEAARRQPALRRYDRN